LFGTDGAGSIVRQNLFNLKLEEQKIDISFLDYGYKELHIEPTNDGGFAIEKMLFIFGQRSIYDDSFAQLRWQFYYDTLSSS
jgi:hypothetical protein